MANHKKGFSTGWLVLIIFMGLTDLALIIRKLLRGHNVALFNPKGLIAKEQHNLMLYVAAILLLIAIPSLFLLYFTAWKYRESNTKATYNPTMKHGRWFNFSVWAIPSAFMVVLAAMMWVSTHRLAPQKLIASDNKPLTIQVVSMRWKWLFIYPEQNIATVNYVEIPIDTPVQFELTADEAPMSSFWIPNLGGQLYTMTGMVNHLNIMADTPGDYPGSTAELNGAGFAGMKFTARASDSDSFNLWVQQAKRSPKVLDTANYEEMLKPSENNPVAFYSGYESGLYDKVVLKYIGPSGGHTHDL